MSTASHNKTADRNYDQARRLGDGVGQRPLENGRGACAELKRWSGGQFDSLFNGPNPDDTAYNVMGTSYGDIGGLALHDPNVSQPCSASDVPRTRQQLYRNLSGTGDTSEIVLYAEIMFSYAYSRRDVSGGNATDGFHDREGIYNVAFWDGSVRTVEQDRDSLRTQGTFVPGIGVLSPIQGTDEWSLYASPRPYPLD